MGYGPGCGYAILAGHDVTRCLATMSLETADLDDLAWEPDNSEDEKALQSWQESLKAKYPVAGKLRKDTNPTSLGSEVLRQRVTAVATAAAPDVVATNSHGDGR